jgi:signal transduction histidine kinase
VSIRANITKRKQVEVDLSSAEDQLRTLVGRLHNVREEEARRIARELHDDLGQHLTAFNLDLTEMESDLQATTSRQKEHFSRMHAGVNHMIEVVQQISGELRLAQLDVLGLTAAIDWQMKEFSRRSNISSSIVRLDEIVLTDIQNTALFRILQEALTNVVRHSGATEVILSLESQMGVAELRLQDNGRGITDAQLKDKSSIGLLGMHERARLGSGNVTITGDRGNGTTVIVRIPHAKPGAITP